MPQPRSGHDVGPTAADPSPPADDGEPPFEPLRLPLSSRRHHPWLLVEVDGSPISHDALVWALREAARREATVLAVAVLDPEAEQHLGAHSGLSGQQRTSALHQLEVRVLRAVAETGVHGRSRTAVLDRPVIDAVHAAASGADLVIVGPSGKTVLRPAVARPPFRRLPRGA